MSKLVTNALARGTRHIASEFLRPHRLNFSQAARWFSGVGKERAATFAERAQLDRGVFYGFGAAGIFAFGAYGVSTETKHAMVQTYADVVRRAQRMLGVDDQMVSERQLLHDYLRVNMLTAWNVIIAAPPFYFIYHLIHKQPVSSCILRGLTGTVRCIPWMAVFYATCAFCNPVLTGVIMQRREQAAGGCGRTNDDYLAAKRDSTARLMFSVLTILETFVELRGCGVAWNQITLVQFCLFLPAMAGRLGVGVMLQMSKVGTESKTILPESWGEESASAMQQRLHRIFTTLSIDSDYFLTLFGTSFCQHINNGIVHILLTKGRQGTVRDVGNYLAYGLDGTVMSAVKQVLFTISQRLINCMVWNKASTQAWSLPALDEKIDMAKTKTDEVS